MNVPIIKLEINALTEYGELVREKCATDFERFFGRGEMLDVGYVIDSIRAMPLPKPTNAQSQWINIDEKLPPGDFYSPRIWLLLSDGRVVLGTVLHKSANATYAQPYHDWSAYPSDAERVQYSGGCDCWKGAKLVAWQPVTPP